MAKLFGMPARLGSCASIVVSISQSRRRYHRCNQSRPAADVGTILNHEGDAVGWEDSAAIGNFELETGAETVLHRLRGVVPGRSRPGCLHWVSRSTFVTVGGGIGGVDCAFGTMGTPCCKPFEKHVQRQAMWLPVKSGVSLAMWGRPAQAAVLPPTTTNAAIAATTTNLEIAADFINSPL